MDFSIQTDSDGSGYQMTVNGDDECEFFLNTGTVREMCQDTRSVLNRQTLCAVQKKVKNLGKSQEKHFVGDKNRHSRRSNVTGTITLGQNGHDI